MKTFFVGIDISKSWLDFIVCDEDQNQVAQPVNVINDEAEIKKLCQDLNSQFPDTRLWFCFEHTGNYGLLLSQVLEELGLTYSIVPPLEIKQSIGMTRGKNDQIDAKRIAEYASRHAKKLIPTSLPNQKLLKVKSHLTYRNQLIKIRQQFKNSRKSHLVSNKSYNIKEIIDDLDAKIADLTKDIKSIDATIEELIKSCLRNRIMKKLLFNGANTAAMHDLELKAYYKRKTAEGKHHLSVTNAIACKLVYRIFAVVKRDEPFVNLVR